MLFKDEKHSGGESKSKQRKNIHDRLGKTLLSTHTHTQFRHTYSFRSPEDYRQHDTGHFREDNICSSHI